MSADSEGTFSQTQVESRNWELETAKPFLNSSVSTPTSWGLNSLSLPVSPCLLTYLYIT